MAMTIVSAIEIEGVGRLKALHESTYIPMRGFQHKMRVVRHEAKQIQSHIIALQAVFQLYQKTLTVLIVPENRLPLIAA